MPTLWPPSHFAFRIAPRRAIARPCEPAHRPRARPQNSGGPLSRPSEANAARYRLRGADQHGHQLVANARTHEHILYTPIS
jgi:hypothetical protein